MEKEILNCKEKYSKRALLIINPVSGKKLVIRYIPEIIRRLMDSGYLVTTAVTSRRGEATEIAAQLGADYDLVCCTGGDGTLNEVISGLASSDTEVALGYIPCGSTNDFAASHGLSIDIPTAAANIAEKEVRQLDIGCFEDSFFSYVAAFGAFSWLSYTTDQNMKNMLGHTAYILDAIKDVYKIKPIHLKLSANGIDYEGDYIFGAVCNSTSIAGTITLPPDIVDTDDGKLEVILIKMPKTILELDMIIRCILSQDYSCPLIDFFQADHIEIMNPHGLEWALDGECKVAYDKVHINVKRSFLKLKG